MPHLSPLLHVSESVPRVSSLNATITILESIVNTFPTRLALWIIRTSCFLCLQDLLYIFWYHIIYVTRISCRLCPPIEYTFHVRLFGINNIPFTIYSIFKVDSGLFNTSTKDIPPRLTGILILNGHRSLIWVNLHYSTVSYVSYPSSDMIQTWAVVKQRVYLRILANTLVGTKYCGASVGVFWSA